MRTVEPQVFVDRFETELGSLSVAVDGDGALLRVRLGGEDVPPQATRDPERCAQARSQLEEYAARERRSFSLPLSPQGSPFELRVWRELERIPWGETISYGELARRVGSPGAARAVGQANHVNPIPIVIPCHRVIGADGKLVGFGGGLPWKRALLDLERGQRTLGLG